MNLSDLTDLMRQYARRGLADWEQAGNDVKKRARHCFGNNIAENEHQAFTTIDAHATGSWNDKFKFIPMPKVNHNGIVQGFFLPIRQKAVKSGKKKDKSADHPLASFDMFLLVDQSEHCLGFRFEYPDGPESTHGYFHAQINRKMFHATLETIGIPDWLPDHYPAFPVRAAGSGDLFLSMLTSVHGYGDSCASGLAILLKDLFSNEPMKAKRFTNSLQALMSASA